MICCTMKLSPAKEVSAKPSCMSLLFFHFMLARLSSKLGQLPYFSCHLVFWSKSQHSVSDSRFKFILGSTLFSPVVFSIMHALLLVSFNDDHKNKVLNVNWKSSYFHPDKPDDLLGLERSHWFPSALRSDKQGCISCGILVSGIGARGVCSEHMENMEMFSCSST